MCGFHVHLDVNLGLHFKIDPTKSPSTLNNKFFSRQGNGGAVSLCPFLWKIATMAIHFACASPWLFAIPITKPFLDFVHILLKCWIKAIHLSPKNPKIIISIYNQSSVHIEESCFHSEHFCIHCQVCLLTLHSHPTNSKAIFSWYI